MHSFRPSRGRILFEVLCAMVVSASAAAAWVQTGASALLGAAGAAALYGLVHLFDMRRPKTAEAQRIDVAQQQHEFATPSAEDEPPAADSSVGQAEPDEPVVPKSGGNRRSGGSRKGNGRRSSARKEVKAAKSADPVVEAVPQAPLEEASVIELTPPAEEEFALMPDEEPAHPHIQPLFEPEPFARMPRRAFGRRGRI
jgi:hypothetical protein